MPGLWIRIAANIGSRKVTWRLADVLRTSHGLSGGQSKAAAVGHLVMLWAGVADHCERGEVGDVADAQLEDWAGWSGEPGVFARWVREHHVTDGRINDWDDFAGKLDDRRERDRERKRTERATQVRRISAGRPADVTPDVLPTSAGFPDPRARTERNGTERKRTPKAQIAASAAVAVADEPLATDPTPEPPHAEPTTNGRAASWLDPIAAEWEDLNDPGTFPWGKAGKALKRLTAHHTPEKIAQHLFVYLVFVDPRYVNLTKFAETFGQWAHPPTVDADGVMTEWGDRYLTALAKRRAGR